MPVPVQLYIWIPVIGIIKPVPVVHQRLIIYAVKRAAFVKLEGNGF
jgi:hypothetical protein